MAREDKAWDIADIVKNNVKLNELQYPDGSVEFKKKQASQLVVENVTSSDPFSPVDGQIWLRTDL